MKTDSAADAVALYELTPKFLAAYSKRLEAWFLEIAEDVYGRRA